MVSPDADSIGGKDPPEAVVQTAVSCTEAVAGTRPLSLFPVTREMKNEEKGAAKSLSRLDDSLRLRSNLIRPKLYLENCESSSEFPLIIVPFLRSNENGK